MSNPLDSQMISPAERLEEADVPAYGDNADTADRGRLRRWEGTDAGDHVGDR